MVLGYIYVMYFSVNLCGVEDSVENYQAYMISYLAVMVFESYGILFFCLDLSQDFHAQLCFHSHFISTVHTSLGCRNVSDRQAFRLQARQIAVTDPI